MKGNIKWLNWWNKLKWINFGLNNTILVPKVQLGSLIIKKFNQVFNCLKPLQLGLQLLKSSIRSSNCLKTLTNGVDGKGFDCSVFK